MKVRIAFYIYTGKWFNFAISAWTWPFNIGTKPYSHVEIGFYIEGKWKYFSSTMRDNAKGTRWIESKVLFKNPERWDVFEKEYPMDAVERMIRRAKSIEGKKYDKLGLLGFVTITGLINDKDNWYCSEAVFFVLLAIWKRRISPRRFSKRILDSGFKKEIL